MCFIFIIYFFHKYSKILLVRKKTAKTETLNSISGVIVNTYIAGGAKCRAYNAEQLADKCCRLLFRIHDVIMQWHGMVRCKA